MRPRTVIFEIRSEDMIAILFGAKRLALPEGARIARWWQDVAWEDSVQKSDAFYVRVEHLSYGEVEPGRRIPQLPAEFAGMEIVVRKPVQPEIGSVLRASGGRA